MDINIRTVADFNNFVEEFESQPGYHRSDAFGVGLAHVSQSGKLLDTSFPYPNWNDSFGTAAVLAHVVGHLSGNKVYDFSLEDCERALRYFAPFENDGRNHPNIKALQYIRSALKAFGHENRSGKKAVVVFVQKFMEREVPKNLPQAYLHLTLNTRELVSLDKVIVQGIEDILPVNAWTSEGPIALKELDDRKIRAFEQGNVLHVYEVSSVPPMLDYVIPEGYKGGLHPVPRLGQRVDKFA